MNYILTMVIALGSTSITSTTQEYGSKTACETAKAAISKQIVDSQSITLGLRTGASVLVATCSAKN